MRCGAVAGRFGDVRKRHVCVSQEKFRFSEALPSDFRSHCAAEFGGEALVQDVLRRVERFGHLRHTEMGGEIRLDEVHRPPQKRIGHRDRVCRLPEGYS